MTRRALPLLNRQHTDMTRENEPIEFRMEAGPMDVCERRMKGRAVSRRVPVSSSHHRRAAGQDKWGSPDLSLPAGEGQYFLRGLLAIPSFSLGTCLFLSSAPRICFLPLAVLSAASALHFPSTKMHRRDVSGKRVRRVDF